MPKLSICVPTYNNPEDVERLLDSIADQNYQDYEVNISDDSTDQRIEKLVQGYKNKITILSYIHNEKPLGHIFNWNAAIQMAKGEYIKIMFSDDWFTFDDSLTKLVSLLEENPQSDIAFCGSRQVMLEEDVNKVKHATEEHAEKAYDRCADEEFIQGMKRDYRRLFLGNQIGCPSAVIYRRTDQLQLFDEESNWASDMFLYFDILQKNSCFSYSLEPLVSIGMHEHQYTESFSEKDMRYYTDYRYLYTKYHLQEHEASRRYFMEEFFVRFHMPYDEARKLGYSLREFCCYKVKFFCRSVSCFLSYRLHLQ